MECKTTTRDIKVALTLARAFGKDFDPYDIAAMLLAFKAREYALNITDGKW